MKAVKVIILASGLVFFASPLFCANVSVLIVETGMRDGKPIRGGEVTELWETGFMDVLFEEGHVVTNAHSFALEKKPEDDFSMEIQGYIEEAETSGIDYFIVAFLRYERLPETNRFAELPKPAGIELNVFNLNSRKQVWTENVALGMAARPRVEEQNKARKIARTLAVHLGDAI
jgi:hypothetical protein